MQFATVKDVLHSFVARLVGKASIVDADTFKSAMRRLAGCVTVIATEEDGKCYGFTATAVCSVCVCPPTVLIAVNKSVRTHQHIDRRGAFSINILADNQKGIAEHFAAKIDDKFKIGGYTFGAAGMPLIDGAAAHLECSIQRRISIGTHTVFVAHVTNIDTKAMAPLIYHDTKYGLVAHI
ncbi:putative flavin reductase [Hyphomicrobium sp. GJ21]|uniref:flavin reductase family protein n=1 Tax=Hyphomicrobium sp. GJ21 TaxID=113574 RepID=UPI000622BB64|nr:flavin reductase family protein [Hyphomicrobium sp. GJ21]CEJ86834.1 putative flavin reductase [Hyphomicrobium sp. GJ21]